MVTKEGLNVKKLHPSFIHFVCLCGFLHHAANSLKIQDCVHGQNVGFHKRKIQGIMYHVTMHPKKYSSEEVDETHKELP
jgi:hypothetical protein